MPFYVYIIQSEYDGTYYIGSTQNLPDRLERHHQGRSKYTKAKRPWKLAYSEEHPDRSSAVKRENQIKSRKSKHFIETLVRTSRFSNGKIAGSPPEGGT
jgi:putative endonuclease